MQTVSSLVVNNLMTHSGLTEKTNAAIVAEKLNKPRINTKCAAYADCSTSLPLKLILV